MDGTTGVLVLDDSVLDKPFARKMDLVHYHWSGKHHRVVKGIDLLTLLWTDGDRHLPCDYRIYDKPTDHKKLGALNRFSIMFASLPTAGVRLMLG